MHMRYLALLLIIVLSVVSCKTPPPPKLVAAEYRADKIIVFKSKRVMYLMQNGKAFRKYSIAVGKRSQGHKIKKGDQRTPEGRYTIISKKANSLYHRSLQISYPNPADIAAAKKRGVNPGSDIVIHGYQHSSPNSDAKQVNAYDWTDGCIRVSNPDLDELWRFVETGVPILINP